MPEKRFFASGARARSNHSRSDPLLARRRKRETLAEKTHRSAVIAGRLAKVYPELKVPLHHRNNFELLVAVMLSAQCTDEAVNRITPQLFQRFPKPERLAEASISEIENIIRSLGLFRAKAKALKECARKLVTEFGGDVPSTMGALTGLAGVGRKTANVILGHAFNTPAIIVDTHCKRLSRRLGLTRQKDPTKIEHDLTHLLSPKEWTGLSHRLIIHGRSVCYARRPECGRCVLADLCPSNTARSIKI